MRTQVGIVGAGPAGLMLSHLLHLRGIESVVLEDRSRAYVEGRIRAGVIEHWAADLLIEAGVGERLRHEGLPHGGINLSFGGALHRIDFEALVGRGITVFGQHEVVRDLIAHRLGHGGNILFEVEGVVLDGVEASRPRISFRHQGRAQSLDCDFIAGCDGFHGVCRPSIPAAALTVYRRDYPAGWLGILAEAGPVCPELIYCSHPRGFALFSMRSPELVRCYLQCAPDEDPGRWSDEAIWRELRARLADAPAAALQEGRILQKTVTTLDGFVVEPMQHERLFLAGDAAHIVPATGAKGMNLAIADVAVLSRALETFYRSGDSARLQSYSATCLRRVWKAQRFSWWMTQLLHLDPSASPFDRRRQQAELDYLVGSEAAMRSLAENYVGLPLQG